MEEVDDYKKYAAELIGTFALVFFGCGSAVIAGGIGASGFSVNNIGFMGIAIAFGVTVLAMVYAIGPISGCHINPAITLAMLTAGKMKARDALVYILAQCVGAILGASVLYYIATGLPSYNLSVNGLGQNGYESHSPAGYNLVSCFLAEVVMTFMFLMVIFGSTSKKAPAGFAGIPIGLSLMVIHLFGIPITGVSVNPARSLGPALVVQGAALEQVWLFWAAPIVGGILAALVWTYVLEDREPAKKDDWYDDEPRKQRVKKHPPKAPVKEDVDEDEEVDEEEAEEEDEKEDEDDEDEDEEEDDEEEDEDDDEVDEKKEDKKPSPPPKKVK